MTADKLKDTKWCCNVKTWKHNWNECGKLNKNEEQVPAKKSEETVLINMSETNKFTKNTWIGDTGATSHMTNSSEGLQEVTTINEQIKMGNAKYMTATKRGKLPCTIKQSNGKHQDCIIEVKVVPEMWCNLFLITLAMKKGFELSSKNMMITIKKENFEFTFDKMGETASGGFLMGVEIVH